MSSSVLLVGRLALLPDFRQGLEDGLLVDVGAGVLPDGAQHEQQAGAEAAQVFLALRENYTGWPIYFGKEICLQRGAKKFFYV